MGEFEDALWLAALNFRSSTKAVGQAAIPMTGCTLEQTLSPSYETSSQI